MLVIRMKYFPGSYFSPSLSCGEPFILLPILTGVFIAKNCLCEHPPFHIPLSHFPQLLWLGIYPVFILDKIHLLSPCGESFPHLYSFLWKVSWEEKKYFQMIYLGLDLLLYG